MNIKSLLNKLTNPSGSDGREAGNSTTTVENVTPESVQQLMKRGVTVLDIRTPAEFGGGRIPGALNIDFQSADFEVSLRSLDSAKPYVVHCAAGGRSTRSLKLFRGLGFKTIYHLDGGFKAWESARLPVEKGPMTRLPTAV